MGLELIKIDRINHYNVAGKWQESFHKATCILATEKSHEKISTELCHENKYPNKDFNRNYTKLSQQRIKSVPTLTLFQRDHFRSFQNGKRNI